MAERSKSGRTKLRRQSYEFKTQSAALEFLSGRLAGSGSDKTAISISEGSLTITLDDGQKTIYRLCGVRVTVEQLVEPARSGRPTTSR